MEFRHKPENNVSVYSKLGCVQCEYTLKALERANIPHVVYKVDDYPIIEIGDYLFQEIGSTRLPVVITNNDSWHGFNPDKIENLSNMYQQAN